MTRRGTLRRFRGDAAGIAAVEFALVAPLLILLYFGATELSRAALTYRKVQNVASTVDQLTAKALTVTTGDVSGIFEAARSIMQPFDETLLAIKLTSVAIADDGRATVAWSRGLNVDADVTGANFTLPEGFETLGEGSMIVSQASFEYHPALLVVFDGSFTMEGRSMMRPRRAGPVTCTDCP